MAVPVSLSVSVPVPQAAGRHQAAGASAVTAPVGGGHGAAPGRARLLPQHGRGAVREETVEQELVILGGGGRRGGCGGHHHVVMLAREKERKRKAAIKKGKHGDPAGSESIYLIVTLEEG